MVELPSEAEPVRVVEGDAIDVLRSLPDGSVDAVVTDPPYSERTHRGHNATPRGHRGQGGDGAARKTLGYAPWADADVRRFVPELCRVARGWAVVMTDHTLGPAVIGEMEACGRYAFAPIPFYAPGSRCRLRGDGPSSWTDWIIVSRPRTRAAARWGTLPGGYQPDGLPGWRDKCHMGGKPSRLMRCLVRDYSRPGDLVLDPFGGSGTTAVACLLEGRRCLLVESDPAYAATARRRVAAALEARAASPPVPP